jgi:tripartite ATP-independent transporter DctP family solute receptor
MTAPGRRLAAWVVAAALVLAAGGCGGGTADGPIEIKFGHVGAPGSLFAESAEEFARRANERLGARAHVVVYGSSQLGTDEVLLQKLRLGSIDLALPSTIMSSTVEEFGLFEMPYLVNDREHMQRIEREIFWPTLAPLMRERGFEPLAVWENGFRHVTNNLRPINTPADLAGIKLRTPSGTWRVRMFQAFGANPTPMAFSEVFVALQTGVMDGQENPLAQIVASRLQEVQSYLSLTRHVYTPAYVTAGSNRWNSLPEDVRQILTETAREVQAYVYDTAARMDVEFLEVVRDANVAINEPDYASFEAASQAIYTEFADSVPGARELLEHALRLAGQ